MRPNIIISTNYKCNNFKLLNLNNIHFATRHCSWKWFGVNWIGFSCDCKCCVQRSRISWVISISPACNPHERKTFGAAPHRAHSSHNFPARVHKLSSFMTHKLYIFREEEYSQRIGYTYKTIASYENALKHACQHSREFPRGRDHCFAVSPINTRYRTSRNS